MDDVCAIWQRQCSKQRLCSALLQEYKEVTRSKASDTGITLIPNEANLFVWGAQLKVGPPVLMQRLKGTQQKSSGPMLRMQFHRNAATRMQQCG